MRLNWYSNAPWAPTGYGAQTAQVVPRIAAAGHEIGIIANYGVTAIQINWNGIPVYPSGYEAYSNDILGPTHKRTGGDWLITLFDGWVIDPKPLGDARVVSWLPVDHDPVPPKVFEWASNHKTIAMSRWGQERLAAVGVKAGYIPHALEPVFRPTPSDVRTLLKVPESAFLVTINAANKGNVPPRKAWGEMFMAYARFARERTDAYLYVHTDPAGNAMGGLDLRVLAVASGIPDERVRWPDPVAYRLGQIGPDFLAKVYSTTDVFLATSMGEGFGIPVIEAQACGAPVIVTDFSAQPELVGGGWTVACQRYWDFGQAAFLAVPLIDDIVAKLQLSYEARGDATMRAAAVLKGAEFEADAVFRDYWVPLLAELEAELRPPTRQQRRAAERKAKKRAA